MSFVMVSQMLNKNKSVHTNKVEIGSIFPEFLDLQLYFKVF